jgi:hypothetical protein
MPSAAHVWVLWDYSSDFINGVHQIAWLFP